MRVRINHPCSSGLYWGQVYDEKHKCWKDVTLSCITRWGARRELRKWVKEQQEKQGFEI